MSKTIKRITKNQSETFFRAIRISMACFYKLKIMGIALHKWDVPFTIGRNMGVTSQLQVSNKVGFLSLVSFIFVDNFYWLLFCVVVFSLIFLMTNMCEPSPHPTPNEIYKHAAGWLYSRVGKHNGKHLHIVKLSVSVSCRMAEWGPLEQQRIYK
jgi:hypothetical protein